MWRCRDLGFRSCAGLAVWKVTCLSFYDFEDLQVCRLDRSHIRRWVSVVQGFGDSGVWGCGDSMIRRCGVLEIGSSVAVDFRRSGDLVSGVSEIQGLADSEVRRFGDPEARRCGEMETQKSGDEEIRRFGAVFDHSLQFVLNSTCNEGLWWSLKGLHNVYPDPTKAFTVPVVCMRRLQPW